MWPSPLRCLEKMGQRWPWLAHHLALIRVLFTNNVPSASQESVRTHYNVVRGWMGYQVQDWVAAAQPLRLLSAPAMLRAEAIYPQA